MEILLIEKDDRERDTIYFAKVVESIVLIGKKMALHLKERKMKQPE